MTHPNYGEQLHEDGDVCGVSRLLEKRGGSNSRSSSLNVCYLLLEELCKHDCCLYICSHIDMFPLH